MRSVRLICAQILAGFFLLAGNAAVSAQQKVEGTELGKPLDITPIVSALIPVKVEAVPKRVTLPAPPVPERPREREEQVVANQPASQVAALAPHQAQTGGGGLFSWLGSLNQPVVEGDVAEPGLTAPKGRVTTLDLTDPYKPKRMSPTDTRDDDLEDDENSKLVEKQVPGVQIACLKPELMALVRKAGEKFGGTPVITSGFRDRGRRGSHHRKCEAADFFITGVSSGQLVSYLKSLPGAGGVGTYCHTKSVHIDTGEPRNWHQCGRRRSFALRTPVLAQIGSR